MNCTRVRSITTDTILYNTYELPLLISRRRRSLVCGICAYEI